MFQSATLKLTGWYLLILMSISLIFSVAIYNVATSEVNTRMERMQTSLGGDLEFTPQNNLSWQMARNDQFEQASLNIFIGLVYANILILIIGGICSYLLARRALRPIEEAHEAQSRFTSDASHELRTPLAIMKTEIEVALHDPKATKDDFRNTLSSNLEEIEKLSRMAKMLLDLSRLEHNKLERTAVNLNKAVADIVGRFNQPDRRISVKTPSRDLIISANQASVEELFTILIDNALKYSPDDSQVTIVLRQQNHKARFEISNLGAGIDQMTLPHIFDRFYRADNSRTTGSKTGYGLGLSLAQKIVELSDGELSVTSAANHPTTFVVLLPIIRRNQAKNQ